MSELYVERLALKSFSMIDGTFYRDFPGHTHAANCYELHYVKDGKGELITDGMSYPLKKNTVYVTGPSVYHMQKTDINSPMYEYCLFFETESETDDILLNIFLSRNFWIGKSNHRIKRLFDEIFKLNQENTLYNARQSALLIELLMLELAKIYEPQILRLENKSDISVTNDIVITDFFFLFNIRNLSLGALSEALGLSERQTQRMLLKNYGKNFQQKKQEAQLEHAKMLLSNEACRLSKIAEECGFYGSAAFCSFFKKHTGITPTEYREKKKSKIPPLYIPSRRS